MTLSDFYKSLTRKKLMLVEETKLNKFLTTFDLTALGIGSTLGVGVYILPGEVSKNVAGPAIILSFAIAAFASLLAGLCYAEFGARVPKAGSAYIYSFVTVGEFIAFLIGWNLILEYAIGSASVAKGITNYIDTLPYVDKAISKFFNDIVPLGGGGNSYFGDYADFFALGLIVVLSLALAFGAKESAKVYNVFTITNLCVILLVIIVGSFNLDFSNWSVSVEDLPTENDKGDPEDFGNGGFFPYGFPGVIKGAAICFYAFIGFDVIATSGEEAKNPKKSIPFSICLSLFVIFLAYVLSSTVTTLMVPYYSQDTDAPLPFAFKYYDISWAAQIVTYGAICGMIPSLYGSIYPLPRVIMAIASDGLLFEIFARIHPKYKTPFYGTLIAGFITGIMACFFNLDQLINMMSIGTFMAYSIVAACVMLLRYEVDDEPESEENIEDKRDGIVGKILNTENIATPTKFTAGLATILVSSFALFCIFMSLVISLMGGKILEGDAVTITLLSLAILGIVVSLTLLARQPKSSKVLTFSVPFVPWFPALSIIINIYLMSELDIATWIRFIVWIAVGLAIYFFYGRRFSKEKERSLLSKSNNSLN